MDGRYRYVRSKEDEIKLLKLEAEFYRSCNAVRQNGYELQQLKNYLVTELLELQKTKEKKIREYASYAQKTIGDLQENKEKLDKELQNVRAQFMISKEELGGELDCIKTKLKSFELTYVSKSVSTRDVSVGPTESTNHTSPRQTQPIPDPDKPIPDSDEPIPGATAHEKGDSEESISNSSELKVKRRRGRPRKEIPLVPSSDQSITNSNNESSPKKHSNSTSGIVDQSNTVEPAQTVKRKRGRPKKTHTQQPSQKIPSSTVTDPNELTETGEPRQLDTALSTENFTTENRAVEMTSTTEIENVEVPTSPEKLLETKEGHPRQADSNLDSSQPIPDSGQPILQPILTEPKEDAIDGGIKNDSTVAEVNHVSERVDGLLLSSHQSVGDTNSENEPEKNSNLGSEIVDQSNAIKPVQMVKRKRGRPKKMHTQQPSQKIPSSAVTASKELTERGKDRQLDTVLSTENLTTEYRATKAMKMLSDTDTEVEVQATPENHLEPKDRRPKKVETSSISEELRGIMIAPELVTDSEAEMEEMEALNKKEKRKLVRPKKPDILLPSESHASSNTAVSSASLCMTEAEGVTVKRKRGRPRKQNTSNDHDGLLLEKQFSEKGTPLEQPPERDTSLTSDTEGQRPVKTRKVMKSETIKLGQGDVTSSMSPIDSPGVQVAKRKRGRPRKIKHDSTAQGNKQSRMASVDEPVDSLPSNSEQEERGSLSDNAHSVKKKRGRPRKVTTKFLSKRAMEEEESLSPNLLSEQQPAENLINAPEDRKLVSQNITVFNQISEQSITGMESKPSATGIELEQARTIDTRSDTKDKQLSSGQTVRVSRESPTPQERESPTPQEIDSGSTSEQTTNTQPFSHGSGSNICTNTEPNPNAVSSGEQAGEHDYIAVIERNSPDPNADMESPPHIEQTTSPTGADILVQPANDNSGPEKPTRFPTRRKEKVSSQKPPVMSAVSRLGVAQKRKRGRPRKNENRRSTAADTSSVSQATQLDTTDLIATLPQDAQSVNTTELLKRKRGRPRKGKPEGEELVNSNKDSNNGVAISSRTRSRLSLDSNPPQNYPNLLNEYFYLPREDSTPHDEPNSSEDEEYAPPDKKPRKRGRPKSKVSKKTVPTVSDDHHSGAHVLTASELEDRGLLSQQDHAGDGEAPNVEKMTVEIEAPNNKTTGDGVKIPINEKIICTEKEALNNEMVNAEVNDERMADEVTNDKKMTSDEEKVTKDKEVPSDEAVNDEKMLESLHTDSSIVTADKVNNALISEPPHSPEIPLQNGSAESPLSYVTSAAGVDSISGQEPGGGRASYGGGIEMFEQIVPTPAEVIVITQPTAEVATAIQLPVDHVQVSSAQSVQTSSTRNQDKIPTSDTVRNAHKTDSQSATQTAVGPGNKPNVKEPSTSNNKVAKDIRPSSTNPVATKPAKGESTSQGPKKLRKPFPYKPSMSFASSLMSSSVLPPHRKRKTVGGGSNRDSVSFQLSVIDDGELPTRKTAIRVKTSTLKTLKLRDHSPTN